MQFNAIFDGGPKDGVMARLSTERFRIGRTIEYGGTVYVIQDGPAAQYFEWTQKEMDNLCVLLKPQTVERDPDHTYYDTKASIANERENERLREGRTL